MNLLKREGTVEDGNIYTLLARPCENRCIEVEREKTTNIGLSSVFL